MAEQTPFVASLRALPVEMRGAASLKGEGSHPSPLAPRQSGEESSKLFPRSKEDGGSVRNLGKPLAPSSERMSRGTPKPRMGRKR